MEGEFKTGDRIEVISEYNHLNVGDYGTVIKQKITTYQ